MRPGAVTSMQLGNGTWESTTFNSRLQLNQVALGTVQNGYNKLKLNYSDGAANNNGNVLSQTITVLTVGSNPGFTAVQNYTYDSLNRRAAMGLLDRALMASLRHYRWTGPRVRSKKRFRAGTSTSMGGACGPSYSSSSFGWGNSFIIGSTADL